MKQLDNDIASVEETLDALSPAELQQLGQQLGGEWWQLG